MDEDRQQWDIVSGVGATALAVASARALESARTDALIHDPYAPAFLEAAHSAMPLPASPEELGGHAAGASGATGMAGAAGEAMRDLVSEYLGVRSRVFDDFLGEAAARGGVRQFVILASGLDTRPFRLPWPPGVRCFELDQPLVLDFKLRVLREENAEPRCAHTPVPVDLRDDWAGALEAAGFDTSVPTAWLAEGLLPYLSPEDEERLFKEIDRLSPTGSRIAVEHGTDIGKVTADDPRMHALSRELDIDLASLLPEGHKRSPEEQLTALGWRHETRTAHESAARFDRDLSSAPALTDRIRHTFAHRP